MEKRCVRNNKEAAASDIRTYLFNPFDYSISQNRITILLEGSCGKNGRPEVVLQGPQCKSQQITIGIAKYLLLKGQQVAGKEKVMLTLERTAWFLKRESDAEREKVDLRCCPISLGFHV